MEINLKTILDWIVKGIVFIIAVTLVAGAGAFLYTKYFIAPSSRAEVKFCVDSESAGLTFDKTVAPLYVEFLKVNEFYEMVSEELVLRGLPLKASAVRHMVSISGVVEDTSVFYARVTASSAQEALEVAEVVAKCAPERIGQLPNKGTSAALIVASNPTLPSAPFSPNIGNNTIYGLMIGFVLSVFLVIIKEMLDNNIKTSEEITELFNLPVLGVVPDFSNQEKEGK